VTPFWYRMLRNTTGDGSLTFPNAFTLGPMARPFLCALKMEIWTNGLYLEGVLMSRPELGLEYWKLADLLPKPEPEGFPCQ
jgi:hypothetical protein